MKAAITIITAAALLLCPSVVTAAQDQSRAERIAENVRNNAEWHFEWALESRINQAVDKALDRAFKATSRESRKETRKNAWTCPTCGQRGNTGAFCSTCGHRHGAPQATVKTHGKDSRTLTPPLPQKDSSTTACPEAWKNLKIVNGELIID